MTLDNWSNRVLFVFMPLKQTNKRWPKYTTKYTNCSIEIWGFDHCHITTLLTLAQIIHVIMPDVCVYVCVCGYTMYTLYIQWRVCDFNHVWHLHWEQTDHWWHWHVALSAYIHYNTKVTCEWNGTMQRNVRWCWCWWWWWWWWWWWGIVRI